MAETDVSVYLGGQSAPHSGVRIRDHLDLGDRDFTAGWDGNSWTAPYYWGARITRWQDARFGWGAEFTHTKVYADRATLAKAGMSHFEFSDGLNIATVNVMYRWPGVLRPEVTPYVLGGVGVSIPHVETVTANDRTWGYQLGGPAVRLGAGVSYAFTERWSAFGEYQFTWSRNDVDFKQGGSLTTDLVTNAVNIGVSYAF
ncbi:outer membrane beta-barrel protein [Thioclava sp. GXIMD4216]|uniref:Outer membrane beta-barrel protein n=1 Tax=Thioclava litoralis TaxID=3076557 RepID=A0ABZ1E4Y9_9RHOB|nr:outer membrane beta-barrel protein [Thioclava sp. FTW29]